MLSLLLSLLILCLRTFSARENSETQKTLQIHSDNANVECYVTLRNTENITDPQRTYQFGVPGKAQNTQKTIQICSENANCVSHGTLRNTDDITNPQLKYELWVPGNAPTHKCWAPGKAPKHRKHERSSTKFEFWVPGKAPENIKHYRSSAEMQIASAV